MAPDHYRTLEVDASASASELRAAYLRLARANHPDRFDGEARRSAETRMQSINEAWNVVGTPHRRTEYDRTRSQDDAAWEAADSSMRGRTHFAPFDEDPIDRADIDLDPTPLEGSRKVPRWISMMPVVVIAWSIVLLMFGFLMNAAAIVAFAVIVFLIGGSGFLLMPLIVMSRAEKDPTL